MIQALDDCGYLSARTFGELRSTGCSDCDYAEQIPPLDKYSVRTPEWHSGAYTLTEMKGWITQAEQHGGGWVPLVFHDICNSCADVSVSLANFTALLDWLQPRAASGTIVETVRQVIGNPPSYIRPKSAAPLRASLVPAYRACTSANRTHGPPLAYQSCSPPTQASTQLTVGPSSRVAAPTGRSAKPTSWTVDRTASPPRPATRFSWCRASSSPRGSL